MPFPWKRLLLVAAPIYAVLFVLSFLVQPRQIGSDTVGTYAGQQEAQQNASSARKNYASAKQSGVGAPSLGNTQKYEKVASMSQRTSSFETDRLALDGAISAHQGLVQSERATGLTGQRVAYLGIGVPADNFDAFIKAVRAIGVTASISVVKNDKTNDYLQLRAKPLTLEKARASLEALQNANGSTDERINELNRLADVEEKIQELGVSLGDFDAQNELCTVKLNLEEMRAPRSVSILRRSIAALE